jgi:hypothetical protein
MLSSFSENAAIHQTLPSRARPIEDYLDKLVDLQPDSIIIEQFRTGQTVCMSETFAGIPNRIFPYPFDDPALAEDIRVKAIIQTPETRSCLQGIQTEIGQCEGSITLSTAGFLHRRSSDFALDIFLLSGTQIYFVAQERVILMNAGDRLIIRPDTPFAVYTIDHSLSVERALFSPQQFPLPNLTDIGSLLTVYVCLMAIGGSEATETYMNVIESLLPEGTLTEDTPNHKIAQATVDLYQLWDGQRKSKQEK